jgi:hypothetical protein
VIFTVSTVKDSRENVQRFVEGNLSSGVDHMFVFLDADDDEVRRYLLDQPDVTTVVTDEKYWGRHRPDNLNHRQMINANLVNCVLASLPWAKWLAHIDGDECLEIDREALLGLDPKVRAVRLSSLESVSEEVRSETLWFKRLLDQEDLALLTSLGVITAPENRRYFSGHVHGKTAVRPALDVAVGIHRPKQRSGKPITMHEGPFQVLHYESFSLDEFVRKWTAQLSGGAPNNKPKRVLVSGAVTAVLRNEHLDASAKDRHLRGIYQRHVQDPVDLLLELGLLVTPRPELHSYRPAGPSESQRRELAVVLEQLLAVDKRRLGPGRELPKVLELMHDAGARLQKQHPTVAADIDGAVRQARAAHKRAESKASAQRDVARTPRAALKGLVRRTAGLQSRRR